MSVEIGFPEPEETTSRLQQMADAALASRIAERDATLWEIGRASCRERV